MADTQIGTRVDVSGVDGTWLGFGRYQGKVSFEEALKTESSIPVPEARPPSAEERAELTRFVDKAIEEEATTPKLVLDDGRVVFGFQCFWTEAEEDAKTS